MRDGYLNQGLWNGRSSRCCFVVMLRATAVKVLVANRRVVAKGGMQVGIRKQKYMESRQVKL